MVLLHCYCTTTGVHALKDQVRAYSIHIRDRMACDNPYHRLVVSSDLFLRVVEGPGWCSISWGGETCGQETP